MTEALGPDNEQLDLEAALDELGGFADWEVFAGEDDEDEAA